MRSDKKYPVYYIPIRAKVIGGLLHEELVCSGCLGEIEFVSRADEKLPDINYDCCPYCGKRILKGGKTK